jgi:hypothetical protein
MGEYRKLYKVLVEKPKGKRPLRKPRHRWKNGITMHLWEIGWRGVWSAFSWLKIGTGGGFL